MCKRIIPAVRLKIQEINQSDEKNTHDSASLQNTNQYTRPQPITLRRGGAWSNQRREEGFTCADIMWFVSYDYLKLC